MGNVASRPGEGEVLYLRDQSRFSISSVTITSPRTRSTLIVSPNAYPATRYVAKREAGDDTLVEYITDPENTALTGIPTFLLRIPHDEDLTFTFTCVLRQTSNAPGTSAVNGVLDTVINGLTFISASNNKELDNLMTREFHADPNLHKNPKVSLLGDYTTGGSASVQFEWAWKWKPPQSIEDKGGGWRNTCSFVEYDSKAHRLEPLARFTFWVHSGPRTIGSPITSSPRLEVGVPPRLRVPSTQSVLSAISDSDREDGQDMPAPQSPGIEPIPEDGLGLIPTSTTATKVDVSCQRPGEDISLAEDGPLFRATMKSMEQKTGNMRIRFKKVLKTAQAALDAQMAANNTMTELMDALSEASQSNSNAVQPAIDHYFDRIAKEQLTYDKIKVQNIQKLIIDPISKLYNMDIKQAESKKKDFEDESREYYAYVGRYLGQRQDSVKARRGEADTKYQSKRRTFELKRFDYSSFMQDLHGGRKDQEVLSHLTRYADAQAKGYLDTAKKIEAMLPQLQALTDEVKEADKEFRLQRTEREEKRRALEKGSQPYQEPEAPPVGMAQASGMQNGTSALPTRQASNPAPVFKSTISSPSQTQVPPTSSAGPTASQPVPSANSQASIPFSSPGGDKFKGIRDLEEKEHTLGANGEPLAVQQRREGLLWALSRPGSHVDPKGINKQAWHKFWIVLDQGRLSEYTNWKEKMDLHMGPIDLRTASVREARNAERRFCFEVITPQFTRVYQATSEEEMKSWINSINSALQSAFEGKALPSEPMTTELPHSTRRDIASVLTGKSSSLSNHRSSYQGSSSAKALPSRHRTVGDRPTNDQVIIEEPPSKLLQQIREADAGNQYCADCGSDSKVDWVSINLGIVLCIECSGIHRSLGTHISKIRSLTLDTTSFTQDIVEILLTVGNRVSNMIWEALLVPGIKPGANATREQRLKFITAKYSDRVYVQPISPTLSHYATAEETLLASIKKSDVRNVLYALALRASPNSHDRSRSTHAVFLALAAADPASPSSTVTSPATSPRRPSSSAGPQSPAPARKSFTIAELLLQNGADIPPQPAPIPLSPAAKLYLEQKAEQRQGKKFVPGSVPSPHRMGSEGRGQGADMLTALPSMVAGNGTTPNERAKERESRLQKRGSLGAGRLVRGPYPGQPYQGT